MIDPRYTEDEQVERLKEWWKKNGTSVIAGVAIGVSVIVGVNFWRDYNQSQAEEASARYAELLNLKRDELKQAGSDLISDYANTPYAALSALYLAKISYEEGDIENAQAMLKWAMQNAKLESNKHAARLRLARIYVEGEEIDQAEQLVSVDQFDGFDSEYQELIGDIAMLKGDAEKARAAYEQALSTLPEGSNYSGLLVMKLDRAIGESE